MSYETFSKTSVSHETSPQYLTLQVCKTMLRTRLPPKFTCQVSKTYGNFSQSHMSKSPKRAFRTRLPPKENGKGHRSTFTSTTTRISRFPAPAKKIARPHLQRAQSTAPATACYLRHTPQPHDSLRLPRKLHFHTSKPAQSTAPVTKSDKIISC